MLCTSFLCKVIGNRSNFNSISTSCSDAYAYEHWCSPNNGGENQLDNYHFMPLLPLMPSSHAHLPVLQEILV